MTFIVLRSVRFVRNDAGFHVIKAIETRGQKLGWWKKSVVRLDNQKIQQSTKTARNTCVNVIGWDRSPGSKHVTIIETFPFNPLCCLVFRTFCVWVQTLTSNSQRPDGLKRSQPVVGRWTSAVGFVFGQKLRLKRGNLKTKASPSTISQLEGDWLCVKLFFRCVQGFLVSLVMMRLFKLTTYDGLFYSVSK